MKELLAYDLSRLRPVNGEWPHFAVVEFALPYCLHVPDDNYVLLGPNDGDQAQVMLFRQQTQAKEPDERPLGERVERAGLVGEIQRLTSVAVCLPLRSEDTAYNTQEEDLWKQVSRKHADYRKKALRLVNELLSTYRYVSREYYVQPLTGRESWLDHRFSLAFNTKLPDVEVANYKLILQRIVDFHGVPVAPPDDLPEPLVDDLREKLDSTTRVPLWEELLLNAYDLVERGNFRLAVIEAETAFEAALGHALIDHYSDNPEVLKQEYRSPIKMVTSNPFKAMLRSKRKKFRKGVGSYDQWKKQVWQLRNKIVHGKRREVNRKEAVEAVRIVEAVLEDLLNRRPIAKRES